jgi:hypothetical protein
MGISIRAYARHRGVSHVAVLKALKSGRIPREADGTIDLVRADAAWERTTDPGRAKGTAGMKAPDAAEAAEGVEPSQPVGGAAVGSVRETLKEQGLSAGPAGRVTFIEARTAHEIAKAHLTRIRLQERRGELVDRAKVVSSVFRLAREERDAWLNWPARVAAVLAAELGIDPHAVQTALDCHVRAHLAELAEVRIDF